MASTKAKATATTTTTTTVKKTAEASTSSSSGSAATTTATATARNKHRVLLFGSRGMTSRDRHLVADLRSLLVHHKKESKFDHKDRLTVINELCELSGCRSVLFFEARKHKDLYLWISYAPDGPSIKFLVQNIHTMAELRMTGNCLKGSRAIISFDGDFESSPMLRLTKEMLSQSFNVPNKHAKSKPFFDHIFTFSHLDGRIWFRNFQIVWPDKKKPGSKMELAEIGPRFVLQPIRVFSASFRGMTLYDNPHYLSPNHIRAEQRRALLAKYKTRVEEKLKTSQRMSANQVEADEIDEVFRQPHIKKTRPAPPAATATADSDDESASE